MRRMKAQDTCEGAARYCFIFQVLAVFSVSCFLITGCDRPSIVGIHSPYINRYGRTFFTFVKLARHFLCITKRNFK